MARGQGAVATVQSPSPRPATLRSHLTALAWSLCLRSCNLRLLPYGSRGSGPVFNQGKSMESEALVKTQLRVPVRLRTRAQNRRSLGARPSS